MVNSIKAYTATQNLTAPNKAQKNIEQEERIKTPTVDVSDEVSLSQEAQEIANIMNIVQKASSGVEDNAQLTLARNAQALDDLLKA